MPNRTPSFVVVGLVIIMFLLGFFYMSCSSTTAELRQTLEDFEERIRTLTMKNSDNEKKIELFNINKRELEEQKINIQKQMEKKDSDINDLNARFNEKIAELENFKSDKQVLEEQIKEFKNISDTLIAKNFAVEKVQQDYDKQINDLKQQIENYKLQLNQSQEKLSIILNQRIQPLLPVNETIQTNNIQKLDNLDQGQNNPDVHQRLQRSLNHLLFDKKLLNDKDINNVENAQKTVNLTSILQFNETNIANNREQLQWNKNDNKPNNNQGEVNINKVV